MSTSQKLDPRNPWTINICDLIRSPGQLKEIHDVLPAPANLGLETIGVPEGEDIAVDVRCESVVEGVLISGEVSADLVGQCSRCLTTIEDHGDFEIQELFFYPGRDADEDALFVVDDLIDLEICLREAVVLNLPFQPLCSEDCLGLCPECGIDLNENQDHSHGEKIDPRWEGLADLAKGLDQS